MKVYPAITCRVCGKEVKRATTAGRPRKTHKECASTAVFLVNTSEPDEAANFVQVSSGENEFWNAMAAKALLRRAAESK